MLLLHHTGAKSGKSRINPLAYQSDDGRYVIFASKAGAPTNPDWYHNLKANPNVKIEVGTDTIDAVASEATGAERDRLFDTQKARVPQFAEYEQKTGGRVIPVIVLTPVPVERATYAAGGSARGACRDCRQMARPNRLRAPGRVAQWESARFTRERSQVRNPPRPFGFRKPLLRACASDPVRQKVDAARPARNDGRALNSAMCVLAFCNVERFPERPPGDPGDPQRGCPGRRASPGHTEPGEPARRHGLGA